MTPMSALNRNAEAATTSNDKVVEAESSSAIQPTKMPNANTDPTAANMDESSPRAKRRLSLAQEYLIKEFHNSYGIDPSDIYFEGDSIDNPYFSFDALSALTIQLAPEIKDIGVEIIDVRQQTGLVVSRGTASLLDGRTRFGDAGCVVGDMLPNGTLVETIKSAMDVSGARALQKALRMVGFDPVRRHQEQRQQAQSESWDQVKKTRLTPEEEQRNNELAEVHILAKEADLIVGDDKSAYYRQLGVFFPGVQSASKLNSSERAQFIAILRGLKFARQRSTTEV